MSETQNKKPNGAETVKPQKGKTMLQPNILQEYHRTTATHHYILGACQNGRIKAYFIHLDLQGLATIFSEKPTNSKRALVIKYRSNKVKLAWMEANAEKVVDLMSEQELKALRRKRVNRKGEEYTENCGDCFEWVISQKFGTTQNSKSNLKFTEGGDLIIDGISYQVKYEKGSISVGR